MQAVGGTACTPSDNRYRDFVQAMNGVEADISDYTTIPAAITQIITAVAGSASPYQLTKPPISSTIKVATDATTAAAQRARAEHDLADIGRQQPERRAARTTAAGRPP